MALLKRGQCDPLKERGRNGTALACSSGRLCRRRLQPRSVGELQTVSMRSARPSFRYSLMRECLYKTLTITSTPRVTTLVERGCRCRNGFAGQRSTAPRLADRGRGCRRRAPLAVSSRNGRAYAAWVSPAHTSRHPLNPSPGIVRRQSTSPRKCAVGLPRCVNLGRTSGLYAVPAAEDPR